ncbi:hypothetical protein BAX94_10165 [Elizabethkingia meningoseptica]|nr:hypothetical protein BGC12_07845 [Elizabethkingia meningoseptica]OPC12586.1 hypothetical protein BAX94_10165 [Elizabethkingia meningoseptica]
MPQKTLQHGKIRAVFVKNRSIFITTRIILTNERNSERLSYTKRASGGAKIIEEISERFADSNKIINKERGKPPKKVRQFL